MAKGKYDETSPRIGFHTWNLDTINEGAADLLNKAFKEALDIATSEYPVYAVLQPKDDVLNIRVDLHLGDGETDNDEDPAWTFSLDEIVADVIELEDSEAYIAKIRDGLRRMADALDARLSQGRA